VDLIPGNLTYRWYAHVEGISSQQGIKPLEAMAIEALTLDDYHRICYWDLSQPRQFSCSTAATVNMAAIIACYTGDRLEDLVAVAHLPDAEFDVGGWTTRGATGEFLRNGWTRYYHFYLAGKVICSD
jgi:hypothetical protein